jgi:hypothetical protein
MRLTNEEKVSLSIVLLIIVLAYNRQCPYSRRFENHLPHSFGIDKALSAPLFYRPSLGVT